MDAVRILKKYYGYDSFRTGQKELIDEILKGNDAVGILPTGGGKSLCYQIPALLLEGITIVISPLISLMKDQVDTLKEYGIKAELINSSLSNREFREIILKAKQGAYKMLYVAPERLETDSFIELMQHAEVSLVAVDEAHCVSQWGHDFRPSYRRIEKLINTLPKRPVVAAFTATATEIVKEDIVNQLKLQTPFEFTGSFDRPNLYFEVRKPRNKFEDLKAYIKGKKGESGIIYCATRKNTDDVCERLNAAGINTVKYHAGLGELERSKNQEEFLFDKTPVMVATNAFGMGIDKPNVRFVIHYNMPKNMESYYQEAGRGGRDGEPAECILLFSPQDIMTNRLFIENGGIGVDHSMEYQKLNLMVAYCNTEDCLRKNILAYFGETGLEPENTEGLSPKDQGLSPKVQGSSPKDQGLSPKVQGSSPKDQGCNNCGSCNNETEQTDITIEAQKILSCIKRMREQFGSTLVTDVLKGANTQKIRDLRFNQLPTYALMKDYSKETIKEIIAFLIAGDYLALVGDQYPILRLTLKSYEVLKGQQKVAIRRVMNQEPENQYIEDTIKQDLFDSLRQVRMQIAREHQVQPFMIFPDTTLKDMCKRYPMTQETMLKVTGVGEHKFEKYGQLFIEAISKYVTENNIIIEVLEDSGEQAKSDKKAKKSSKQTSKASAKDSHKYTYTLYKEGLAISEIAEKRSLTLMTVENHLLKCFEEGFDLDYSEFIPKLQEEQIAAAIEKCGTEFLKPIKEALPDEVSYTAIKFALCKYKESQ